MLKDFTMSIDSTISIYELVATSIALLALVQPWIGKLFRYFFRRLKISFIEPKSIRLFYNKSGAYVSINGVLEAKNRTAIIRDIEVKIIRESDKAELDLDWSTFCAPTFQQIGNNPVITPVITNEVAHPFLIIKDTVIPVYTEFALANQRESFLLEEIYNEIDNLTNTIISSNKEFDKAKENIKNSSEYCGNYETLLQNFYWKTGKYILNYTITFNDKEHKTFVFNFELSNDDSELLKKNIENSLLSSLNINFNTPVNLRALQKEICPANKDLCIERDRKSLLSKIFFLR